VAGPEVFEGDLILKGYILLNGVLFVLILVTSASYFDVSF